MLTSQLPILPVLLPLVGAPVCALLRNAYAAWIFACLVSAGTFACAVALLWTTPAGDTLSYTLGGWAAPWGIEYRLDRLNMLVLLVVSGVAALVLPAGRASFWREIAAHQRSLFFAVFLLCFAGFTGITATGDAFNLFVFLEISSLSTYALIAMGQDRRALVAAYNYLVLGTIGATFILIGIGFIYMMTGTLNMADLAERLPGVGQSNAVFCAYAFIVVGICLKLALFPLHFWLPGAYTYAPSMVTAFLAATATKVALYVLIRFSFSIFHIEFSALALPLKTIFIVLGLCAIFAGSMVAIYASDFKRGLAYSSVAQVGFLICGIGLGTVAGLQATLIHLFNHALMKVALFLALAAVIYRFGNSQMESFRGLGRRMPLTAACLMLGGVSLIGIPGTAGFISKWYLVLAAAASGQWLLVVLILLGSLLTAIYIWRVVELVFAAPENGGASDRSEAPPLLLAGLILAAVANVYFGLDTRLPVTIAHDAAVTVMGEVAP